MTNKELPNDCEDVMITFQNPHSEDILVKKGFYVSILGTFSIPYEWALFNGELLPHGFGGWHLTAKQIIKWEKINNHTL